MEKLLIVRKSFRKKKKSTIKVINEMTNFSLATLQDMSLAN